MRSALASAVLIWAVFITSGHDVVDDTNEVNAAVVPDLYRGEPFKARVRAAVSACATRAVVEESGALQTVRIRVPPASASARKPLTAMLVFGEHARELVSPELGLVVLRSICAAIAGAASQTPVDRLFRSALARGLDVTVVPLANPWGHARVLSGDACRRTNAAGVDLNRNWDAHWAPADATTLEDSLPGPHPFSEAETRTLRSLVDARRPVLFLTVHSGTVGMYFPPAYTLRPTRAQRAASARMSRILASIATAPEQQPKWWRRRRGSDRSQPDVPYGPAGREVSYPCPGTCLDYAFERSGVPVAIAFEIWDQRERDVTRRWLARRAGERADALLLQLDDEGRAGTGDAASVGLGGGVAGAAEEATSAEEFSDALARRMRGAHSRGERGGRTLAAGRQSSIVAEALARRADSAGVRALNLAAAEIGLTDGMSPAECVRYFNPLSRDELDETLRVWEARVALLLDHAGRGVSDGSLKSPV